MKMAKKIRQSVKVTSSELQAIRLEERVTSFYNSRSSVKLPVLKAKTDFGLNRPVVEGIYDRTPSAISIVLPPWRRLLSGKDATDASKVLDPKAAKTKTQSNADYIGTYNNFNGILRPEYDMLEPFVIFDTEAYVKRAVGRRLDLMFRNGYEIGTDLDQTIDQGQLNVDYIYKRLNTIEYVTNEPVNALFKKILFNLLLCSNCFLRKVRDEKLSAGVRNGGGVGKPDNGNKIPVAFYQLIPAHTILPYFEKGKIIRWRRFYETGAPWEDFSLDEILHLKWDVKPGHVYGTPRTVGVRDDIWALRRFEENIELLFVNHLFPFFHVKIGTDNAPCWYGANGESEIDTIRYQVETMPKEGVFVSDARVDVGVVGAEGKSLETKDFLAHLKSRVFTGLGVSGIDMGEGADATRATADNISQNLKDTVKSDMESFGDIIRMNFFKEWFMEANYSIGIQKAVSTTKLIFHEIDLDNLIKEQNHTLNLYNAHLLTEPEARKKLKKPPMTKADKKLTHYNEHVVDLVQRTAEAKSQAEVKAQKELLPLQAKHQEEMTGHKVNEMQMQHKLEHKKMQTHVAKAEASVKLTQAKTKLAAVQGARPTGAVKKATPSMKTGRNRATPSNQHKVSTGPMKAKSSREEFHRILSDMLLDGLGSGENLANWPIRSSNIIDTVLENFETNHSTDIDDPTSGYTRKVRQGLSTLKGIVAQTTDPELLAVLIDAWDGDDNEQPEVE
jgi:hypothetical protein